MQMISRESSTGTFVKMPHDGLPYFSYFITRFLLQKLAAADLLSQWVYRVSNYLYRLKIPLSLRCDINNIVTGKTCILLEFHINTITE